MPRVANPSQYPYSCIGLLAVTFPDGSAGWGSGALVHEKYVVTCGHNILYNDKLATSAMFFPAHSSDKEPAGGIQIDRGFLKNAYAIGGDPSWDIGIYRLQNPHPLPKYMSLEIVEENNEPPKEMTAAGYPGNRHFEMWEEEELVSGFNVPQHIFAYTHETYVGSSGSPLFRMASRNARIYGVHSGLAINLQDKVGVLITQPTRAFACAAIRWGKQAESFVIVID